MLADGDFSGQLFTQTVNRLLEASMEIAKRNELPTFAVIPKRGVVERSFAWLEKCQPLWKICERQLPTSLQFVVLAFLRLLLKR
jgi:transposase